VKIVALLPMKGHSERVSGKNFREFNGKPLFKWILDTLIDVEEIDQIIINTDARSILASHGLVDTERIIIRDREPKICGDFVSMNLIIEDDINNVESDIYLMTHTTNPFLSIETVKGAIKEFCQALSLNKSDSLFTVDKIQTRFYRADSSAVNHDPNNLIRTQDLEPWFEENSNLYLFTKSSFASTQARIGSNPMLYISPRFESIDIDDAEDWEFAMIAAKMLENKKQKK
jgi:CMP-N-acetylneuraminic acid synthetase